MSFQNYINHCLPESFPRADSPPYPLIRDIVGLALFTVGIGNMNDREVVSKVLFNRKCRQNFPQRSQNRNNCKNEFT